MCRKVFCMRNAPQNTGDKNMSLALRDQDQMGDEIRYFSELLDSLEDMYMDDEVTISRYEYRGIYIGVIKFYDCEELVDAIELILDPEEKLVLKNYELASLCDSEELVKDLIDLIRDMEGDCKILLK